MIEIGDPLPDLGTQVLNSAGALAAGGAVSLVITLPDLTTVSPAISNPSLGIYTATYIAVQLGPHDATWTVTGANAGVNTDHYDVESAIGIVSLAYVKNRLNVRRVDHDDLLRSLIAEASDLCEGPEGTGQTWRRTVVTNELHSGYSDSIVTNRRPISSVTALTVDGVVQVVANFDVESWRLFNPNGVFSSSLRRNNASISYVAAPAGVTPPGVRNGVVEMVRHLYAPMRGGSGIPRQEEPDFTPGSGYLIPNRVLMAWRQAQSGF